MRHEIFVVWKTDEADEGGEIIYENPNWEFRGNKWEARDYAHKNNYGAGVEVYDRKKKKYIRLV